MSVIYGKLSIDFHINNFTALLVEILDDIQLSTNLSNFSFYPCEIDYLKIYTVGTVAAIGDFLQWDLGRVNAGTIYTLVWEA